MIKIMTKIMIKSIWNKMDKLLYIIIVRGLHITILEKNWEKFLQFVKFGIIGVSNTVISYLVYIISLFILQKNSLFI